MMNFRFWRRQPSRTDGQIILRKESYGGMIFHPEDATFVQLDPEGYECVARVLGQRLRPRNKAERRFVRQVRRSLPTHDLPVRIVDGPAPGAHRSQGLPGVLSAPVLVDFQITERCGMGCPQCYASSVPKGRDLEWEDALLAIEQMKEAGVCQVALGGGEPILYPRLAKLLELIRSSGMVPNLTTTGVGMTDSQLAALKAYCGAVAMSLEGIGERFSIRRRQGFEVFNRVARRLLDAEIPLVFQVTVSSGNLEDLDSIVDYCLSVGPLYGVIFLAHKPAGRAVGYDLPLSALAHPRVHDRLLSAVRKLRPRTRVGFDCCFTPAVVGLESDLGFENGDLAEGCSATRSALGLTPSLDVLPCTFLSSKKIGNLREKALGQIWNEMPAKTFRSSMEAHRSSHASCGTCPSNHACLGGCSAWSLVGCMRKSANRT